jgi:phosphoglucomutase
MDAQLVYNAWLAQLKGYEKDELLSIKNDPQEIQDRFSTELEFGTAGMRGEIGIGTARMNTYTVTHATQGVGKYIRALGSKAKQRGVVIAYDTRKMSREFAFTCAKVFSHYGVKVRIFEDVRPVPMLSFAVRYYSTVAGVMITASHNPKEYNGYKVYGEDGAQMSPDATKEVVKYIEETKWFAPLKRVLKKYDIYKTRGMNNEYIEKNIEVIGKSLDDEYYKIISQLVLSPKILANFKNYNKIVYTPIHGTGKIPVITMLKKLGMNFTVVKSQIEADPEFSTVVVPNPENEETLNNAIKLAQAIKSDICLATDPDCDRLGIAVRNAFDKFVLLTGNQIGILLLDYILMRLNQDGKLPKNAAIVRSLVSTSLADKIAKSYGVASFSVPTGFKFIGEKIKEWEESGEYEYVFGFEESFGTLRGTHARDKDAVVGSVLAAEMYIYYKSIGKNIYQKLEELFEKFGYYTEKNITTTYKGLTGMQTMADVMEKMRDLKLDSIANYKIIAISDYLNDVKTYVGSEITEALSMPRSNMIYWELEDGQFVCIRPSGTEPKLKIYVLVCASNKAQSFAKAEEIGEKVKLLCQ